MKAILFSPFLNPKNWHLIKETHAKISSLKTFYNFFLIRIDFNFNHFVISLVLTTLSYGKANKIEMIEDLGRVKHGNVRCFDNL